MRTITRPLDGHAYSAGSPQRGAADGPGHVIIHEATAQMPHPGMTPLSSPGYSASWASDGAPFYNSGYAYPQHGPLITGGFPSLRLPQEAAQLDLTDTTTWDRPVWMLGAR